ncbi:MAG: hypothetical protein KatS3mg060_2261 [Dehalococcoidia bacterium]|nr:MAG: hypothetical protein KatS3mg060_2261 [Dehalococcoidia bacterium]
MSPTTSRCRSTSTPPDSERSAFHLNGQQERHPERSGGREGGLSGPAGGMVSRHRLGLPPPPASTTSSTATCRGTSVWACPFRLNSRDYRCNGPVVSPPVERSSVVTRALALVVSRFGLFLASWSRHSPAGVVLSGQRSRRSTSATARPAGRSCVVVAGARSSFPEAIDDPLSRRDPACPLPTRVRYPSASSGSPQSRLRLR